MFLSSPGCMRRGCGAKHVVNSPRTVRLIRAINTSPTTQAVNAGRTILSLKLT